MKGDCTPFFRVCMGIPLSSCIWISFFSFHQLSLHNTDFNVFQRKRNATEFVTFWAIPNSGEDTQTPSFTQTKNQNDCSLSVTLTVPVSHPHWKSLYRVQHSFCPSQCHTTKSLLPPQALSSAISHRGATTIEHQETTERAKVSELLYQ